VAQTRQVYRGGGREAARAVVRTGLGRLTMDWRRATVLGLERQQTDLMARFDRMERSAARRTLLAVTALAAVTLGLFGAVSLLLWRAIEAGRRREAALDERVRERTAEVRRRVAEVETLFEVVPTGIGFARDPECRDIRLNPALARMLRVEGDQNASKSSPEADRLPFRVVGYDGQEIPAEQLVLQRAARTGRPVHNEAYQIVYEDGTAIDLLGSAAPLFDEHGRVRGAVGAFVDVSERRRADEQLQHAQRMQAVGQLAGGVAHEINNLMTTVLGFGEFALRGLPEGHPAATDLKQVVAAGRRAADVAQQLLAFSRRQVVTPRVLALDTAMAELRSTLERMLGATVDLETRLEAGRARVRIDLGQLYQVLINLAANARDAMPEGGTLLLATGTRRIDAGFARGRDGEQLPPGDYASIVVRDTGIGMGPEVRRRAFEPFFTTKEVGTGTGLGLSIVYGIVQSAGGAVLLASEPGQGTRVEVVLPLVDEPETTTDAPASTAVTVPGRVLLVEDDDVVRALGQRALSEAGFEVVTASDGEAAKELLARGPHGWDLVITDLVMPRLGGRALGRWIGEQLGGLPVIYTSGHPGEDPGLGTDREEPGDFLAKPFTPEALVQRVRDVLDRAASS
jgi:signal transduction histidine kinase